MKRRDYGRIVYMSLAYIDVVIKKEQQQPHVNAHFTDPRQRRERWCRIIEYDLLRPNTRCSVSDSFAYQ